MSQSVGFMDSFDSTAMILLLIIDLAVVLFYLICTWKIFAKAGRPGWAALIPIYNTIVMIQIAGRPLWWFFLLLIPIANIVFSVIITIDLVKAYGKPGIWALGIIFLSFIFIPILAFDSSEYIGNDTRVA